MTDEKSPTLFESLLAVQKELKTVTKNKKGYSGTYADIENIWESIREIINGNGFVILHQVKEKGVNTIALHVGGEKLESFIPFIEFESRISDKGKTTYRDPQEQGKEITYAKRYNINAIFNVIVADEDNDANKNLGNYKKSGVNGELAAKKLLNAKSHDEAVKIYSELSKDERITTEVVSAVDEMRKKYQTE